MAAYQVRTCHKHPQDQNIRAVKINVSDSVVGATFSSINKCASVSFHFDSVELVTLHYQSV